MDRIYIGIDPGKDGALAIIWPNTDAIKGRIDIIPFCEEEYAGRLRAVGQFGSTWKSICCLEKVGAMPKQGVTSCFNFGDNFGFIRGLLTAYSIPYELVRPQKWKKEYSLTADKKASITVCKRLFPDVSLRRTDKCKTDHDGMAEALLMAEYARRKL